MKISSQSVQRMRLFHFCPEEEASNLSRGRSFNLFRGGSSITLYSSSKNSPKFLPQEAISVYVFHSHSKKKNFASSNSTFKKPNFASPNSSSKITFSFSKKKRNFEFNKIHRQEEILCLRKIPQEYWEVILSSSFRRRPWTKIFSATKITGRLLMQYSPVYHFTT